MLFAFVAVPLMQLRKTLLIKDNSVRICADVVGSSTYPGTRPSTNTDPGARRPTNTDPGLLAGVVVLVIVLVLAVVCIVLLLIWLR